MHTCTHSFVLNKIVYKILICISISSTNYDNIIIHDKLFLQKVSSDNSTYCLQLDCLPLCHHAHQYYHCQQQGHYHRC